MMNIQEIKALTMEEVELPGWNDTPFVACLKRPSLLHLVKRGIVPNALLSAAQELFDGRIRASSISMLDVSNVIELVVKEALVSPTYAELEDADIELTDQQYMAIFNYTQAGLAGLETFRKKR